MKSIPRGWSLALLATAFISAMAGGSEGQAFDLTKKVWVDGEAVNVFVQMPQAAGGKGPNAATDAYADVEVYLIGAIDEQRPFGPEMRRPAVDPATGKPMLDAGGQPLGELVIPAHDDTFARFADAAAPVDTFGYWIIAGPKATSRTVRTRGVPKKSLSGAPLAYEIRLDGRWQPLTRASVVARGLAAGLIEKRFSNWGGVAWLERPAAGPVD